MWIVISHLRKEVMFSRRSKDGSLELSSLFKELRNISILLHIFLIKMLKVLLVSCMCCRELGQLTDTEP